MSFRWRELGTLEEIREIESPWSSLAETSPMGSLFVTPAWQLSWLASLDAVRPAVVAIEDEAGRLRGVLPMARAERRLGLLTLEITQLGGDEVASGDHLGMVAQPEDLDATWDAARDWLARELGRADLARFPALDEGPNAAALLRIARAAGWSCLPGPTDEAPWLALPDSYEDFERSLGEHRRKRTQYYLRRLARECGDITLPLNDEVRPIDEVLDDLVRLHTLLWVSRGRSGTLAEPRKRRFLQLFCAEAHRLGWLRLHQMYAGRRLVAAVLIFHRNGTAYYYQSGWDVEFARYNVGELLVVESIRRAIAEKVRLFDFLRGDEPYKRRFTATRIRQVSYDLASSRTGRLFLRGLTARRAAAALRRLPAARASPAPPRSSSSNAGDPKAEIL